MKDGTTWSNTISLLGKYYKIKFVCFITQNEKWKILSDIIFFATDFFTFSKVPAFLNIVDIAGLVEGANEGQVIPLIAVLCPMGTVPDNMTLILFFHFLIFIFISIKKVNTYTVKTWLSAPLKKRPPWQENNNFKILIKSSDGKWN